MFVPGNCFHVRLEPTQERPTFQEHTNIRLGWKDMPGTNTLAYQKDSYITDVNSFITLVPGLYRVNLINHKSPSDADACCTNLCHIIGTCLSQNGNGDFAKLLKKYLRTF
jgi:hypothetical protein